MGKKYRPCSVCSRPQGKSWSYRNRRALDDVCEACAIDIFEEGSKVALSQLHKARVLDYPVAVFKRAITKFPLGGLYPTMVSGDLFLYKYGLVFCGWSKSAVSSDLARDSIAILAMGARGPRAAREGQDYKVVKALYERSVYRRQTENASILEKFNVAKVRLAITNREIYKLSLPNFFLPRVMFKTIKSAGSYKYSFKVPMFAEYDIDHDENLRLYKMAMKNRELKFAASKKE